MRILSVAEINTRAVYRHRVVSPLPRDPMLPQYIRDGAIDEEVAAIMASSPINVAPLIMYVEYNSPHPIYPELSPTIDDNSDDEELDRVWQAQEEEENAARIMARQAEVQAEAEEEEAARMRLLREINEEEEEMEEEDGVAEELEEEEEDRVHDSGLESIDSDAETVENVFDGDEDRQPQAMDDTSGSSSSSDDSVSDSDRDEPYDPVRDPEREARLHRLLGIQGHLYRVKQKILRLKRRETLLKIKNKIRRARDRRVRFVQNLTRTERRGLPLPQVERPRRNRDFCYGCGRFYLVQRVRWWWRCDECGFWLCPDCNTDPLHCQRNQLI